VDEIKKILAPTDLSELSGAGVRYALRLAEAIDAEVTIYHVVDYDALTRYGQRSKAASIFQPPDHFFLERYQTALSGFLKKHVADHPTRLKVQEKVELGAPDKKIVEYAEAAGIDLIVMSTEGKTGPQRFVGSVTEKVVRTSPCPVLSTRPRRHKNANRFHNPSIR
jgi:nucleotide-binding universal stress UspA family protein